MEPAFIISAGPAEYEWGGVTRDAYDISTRDGRHCVTVTRDYSEADTSTRYAITKGEGWTNHLLVSDDELLCDVLRVLRDICEEHAVEFASEHFEDAEGNPRSFPFDTAAIMLPEEVAAHAAPGNVSGSGES